MNLLNIPPEALTYGIMVFIVTVCAFLVVLSLQKKASVKSEKIIQRLHNVDVEKEEKKKKTTKFIEKLDKELREAEINLNPYVAITFISCISVLIYILAFIATGSFIVPIALLPFPIYFVPVTILDSKRMAIKSRFETEFVMVLRRMSAITKNDSVLKALEDVKDYPSFSPKMRFILTKIYTKFQYGDSIENAFLEVAPEVPSEDFKKAALTIAHDKQLGANLSLSLNQIATNTADESLRKKNAKSLLATGITTGKIMSVAPYAILIYLFSANGSYFDDYFASIQNQVIFAAIMLFMSIGVFVVQKISREEIK